MKKALILGLLAVGVAVAVVNKLAKGKAAAVPEKVDAQTARELVDVSNEESAPQ